jgi:hypothetical protein
MDMNIVKNFTTEQQLDDYEAELAAPDGPGGWRLPSRGENSEFIGTDVAGTTATNPYFITKGGVNVLPAAGQRMTDGTMFKQGLYALYWSSTPSFGTVNLGCLGFIGGSNAGLYDSFYSYGQNVRCVRN